MRHALHASSILLLPNLDRVVVGSPSHMCGSWVIECDNRRGLFVSATATFSVYTYPPSVGPQYEGSMGSYVMTHYVYNNLDYCLQGAQARAVLSFVQQGEWADVGGQPVAAFPNILLPFAGFRCAHGTQSCSVSGAVSSHPAAFHGDRPTHHIVPLRGPAMDHQPGPATDRLPRWAAPMRGPILELHWLRHGPLRRRAGAIPPLCESVL
jgi:hypothetical protein